MNFFGCGYQKCNTLRGIVTTPKIDIPIKQQGISNTSYVQKKVELYTTYLGLVTVTAKVKENDDNIVLLECNKDGIYHKILDAKQYGLKIGEQYSVQSVKASQAVIIDKRLSEVAFYCQTVIYDRMLKMFGQVDEDMTVVLENLREKWHKDQIFKTRVQDFMKQQTPELDVEKVIGIVFDDNTAQLHALQNIYHAFSSYNAGVDVMFATQRLVSYAKNVLGLPNGMIDNNPDFLSLINFEGEDNAYYDGTYMKYGDGATTFYSVVGLDVIIHELTHRFVRSIAKLPYKSESGALDESLCDCIATAVEQWVDEKYPKLFGKKNWTVGEDSVRDFRKRNLRDLSDPHNSMTPQPKTYKGQYWTNDPNFDHGGVHFKSGVGNYCFYLMCKKQDKDTVVKNLIECYRSLPENANFNNYRDALLKIDPSTEEALTEVGLSPSSNNPPSNNFPNPNFPNFPNFPNPNFPNFPNTHTTPNYFPYGSWNNPWQSPYKR